MSMSATASFRDPENAAFEFEGAWYRIAAPVSASALDALLASPLYADLVAEGVLIPFSRVEGDHAARVLAAYVELSGRTVDADARVYAVPTIEVITYPWEWPNSLLEAAALLTLDLRTRLLDIGLDLKDASAFNVQFDGLAPKFIDIGSIETWRPNPSWNASRQFIEHFINPLAVGSGEHVTAADAWALSRHRGLRSDAARQLLPKKRRRSMSLALLQATTKPVSKNAPSETRFSKEAASNPELALSATKGLVKRLRKQIDKLHGDAHDTTWVSYGSREHYEQADLTRKSAFAADFISAYPGREGRVLDVGGNDGFTASRLVRDANATVIVMDADAGALDMLNAGVSQQPEFAARITPLLGDITNLTPASGLLDAEFASFTSRIRPTAVICQAVLHHVVITQGTPMPFAIEALARFGAPVQIEFATPEDEKVRLLLSQIPNWSGDYSTEALLAALRARFAHVEQVGTTSATRIVVNAWN